MRRTLGMTAAAVVGSLSLLAVAATSASAAPLAAAARFDPQPSVAAGLDLLEVRHRYRHYGDDFYYGYYPFTLNDYPPYVAAHPPRYRSPARRHRSRSCSYWSDRCVANWGAGNSNYLGCLRYHGC